MDGHHAPPETSGWRLSLVIPAYNEADGIVRAIAEADDALRALAAEYEVLVVDDGSRDGTADAARRAAQDRPNVRVLVHERNRGYGAALRTGFEAARFDRVAFTDADCQFHLDDLNLLLPLTRTHPIAVGWRIDRKDPARRRFFSWGYNVLVRTLLGTGVRDCDCALKVFRRDALRQLLPESRGFFVNTEMLTRARQQGLEVAEAGVRHRPRAEGESKVSVADIPRTLAVLLPFWWSRAVFAGRGPTAEPTRRGPEFAALFAVLLAACALFFARLDCPLLEPDEARYAEIPRQMLAGGDFLVPVLHGQPYYDKPPLLYWLVMGSYRLFGVSDWAARLVPGLVGVLTVLVTYLWGRWALGRRPALVGAAVLCLSARFVYMTRMLAMDGLLCLCVIAALAALHRAVAGPSFRRGWWLLSAVACGLGLLTKGPVILILLGVPLLALAFLDRRLALPRGTDAVLYLLTAGLIAGPWFVALGRHDPEFLSYFFWKHNLQRYVAPFDHEGPVWYYLPGLLLGLLPWTLLLPVLVAFLARRRRRTAERRPAALGFLLLASAWCVVFFSLSGSKRPGYILPALPPLALALGFTLHALLPQDGFGRVGSALLTWGSRLAYRATVVALFLGVGLGVAAVVSGLQSTFVGSLIVAAGAGTLAFLLATHRRPVASWAVCGTVTFGVLLVAIGLLLPSYARRFSLRGQVRPLAEQLEPGTPVACYPRRWDSVSFYLRRDDVRAYTREQRAMLIADLEARPDTLLFVKAGHALDDLLRDLPAKLAFVPTGRQGTSVVVGRVVHRPDPPNFWYAGHPGRTTFPPMK